MKQQKSVQWVRIALLHAGIFAIIAAVIALLSLILGSACPLYALFGICCPFCGMTRAHLAALRLDFSAALAYHPAFLGGIPFLFLLLHKDFFKTVWQRVLWWILTVLISALLLGTYITRIITTGGLDFFA